MHRGVSSIFFIHDKPIIGKRVEEPFQISSQSIFCKQRFFESPIKYSFFRKKMNNNYFCMRWTRYNIFCSKKFPLLDNSFGGYLYFTFRNCRKTNYSKSRGWALKPQPFGKCKDGITFKRSNLHTKGLKSWQLAKCGAVSSCWSHSFDTFNDDDTTSGAGCHYSKY